MPTPQEIESLRSRLSMSFWVFLASVVVKLTLDYVAGGQPPGRMVILTIVGFVVFFAGYLVYALACVRAARGIGRSANLTTAYFAGLPLAVLLLSLGIVLLGLFDQAIFGALGCIANAALLGLLRLLLEVSPIAFYISLRAGLNDAQHDAIFAED